MLQIGFKNTYNAVKNSKSTIYEVFSAFYTL